MPLDPDYLMSYPIPPVTQTYTEKDCAFYALSIGVGQNPLDCPALKFVGGAGSVTAFPSMPLVLGHPGFWLGQSNTGVDAERLVHGEESFQILGPIGRSGTVTGTTRVTGLVDKGEGRGALLYSEKVLTDEAGKVIARTQRTTFLRGDGGFGKSTRAAKSAPKIPYQEPDILLTAQTRPEQALYYRWNGDENLLHVDPNTAKSAGFNRPILHGLCTYGIAARLIVASIYDNDPAALCYMSGRFTAPVYPGDCLRILIWKSGHFRVLRNNDNCIVLDNGAFGSQLIEP